MYKDYRMIKIHFEDFKLKLIKISLLLLLVLVGHELSHHAHDGLGEVCVVFCDLREALPQVFHVFYYPVHNDVCIILFLIQKLNPIILRKSFP